MRRPPTLTVLALGLVLGSGCASGDGMQEKLYDATRRYNRSLRWGDFDRAAEHLPAASVDRFLDEHERVGEKLVILDYQLTRLKMDKQVGTAACRIEISWHTDRRLIVEDTVVDQAWQWHDGGWVLVDERRVTGTPLAIFAEGRLEDGEHPYLPGLAVFRDAHDIGIDDKEKRRRERSRRRSPAPEAPIRAGWVPTDRSSESFN